MGLDLIAAHNGWAMALTGALIVVLGLSTLAFIISQLHKVILLFEKSPETPPETSTEPPPSAADADLLTDLPAAALFFKGLTTHLGSNFTLIDLYRQISSDQMPHPHLTIRSLRESGFLVPVGDGRFIWKDVSAIDQIT